MPYEILKEDGYALLKEDGFALLLEFASRKTKTKMFPDRDIFISEHERIIHGDQSRPTYGEYKR